jgi:hypothetical protein
MLMRSLPLNCQVGGVFISAITVLMSQFSALRPHIPAILYDFNNSL